MNKKILAFMLMFALIFSLSACKKSEDEESALSEQVNSGGADNSQTDTPNDNAQSDYGDVTAPGESTDTEEEKNEQVIPPLSTDGKYLVTFDFGFEDKTETEKTDGKLTQITPTRSGYTFEGWFDGNNKWDFSKNVSEDMTLTAKWNIITYSITYKDNGAKLPSSLPKTYTVESSGLTLEPATKKYRAFTGWVRVNADGSTTSMDSITSGTTGNMTLMPIFDEETLLLGTYEQDADTSNGKEAIEWIKIKEENGKALYMSKYILAFKPYNDRKQSVLWSNCTLRKWLNDSFYKNAFSAEDKALVIYSDIHTPANSQTGLGTAVDTKDYVFLLSLEECESYTSWAQRKAKNTKYAFKQSEFQTDPGGGDWWLRSVGCYNNYAAIIQQNSGIRENGYQVSINTIGVRPCIWVDLSKFN